jgi:hypothetical protein
VKYNKTAPAEIHNQMLKINSITAKMTGIFRHWGFSAVICRNFKSLLLL